jgi:glucan phosphoethanolaminetransferase (alkaline phosphatase superfamily)
LTALSSVKDSRRKQRQRYSVEAMLLLVIICALRNLFCYRQIGRFCKNNQKDLVKRFGFKNNQVQSYVSFRTFIKNIDFVALQTAFHIWTKQYVPIDKDE